jgi:hypothetical protein
MDSHTNLRPAHTRGQRGAVEAGTRRGRPARALLRRPAARPARRGRGLAAPREAAPGPLPGPLAHQRPARARPGAPPPGMQQPTAPLACACAPRTVRRKQSGATGPPWRRPAPAAARRRAGRGRRRGARPARGGLARRAEGREGCEPEHPPCQPVNAQTEQHGWTIKRMQPHNHAQTGGRTHARTHTCTPHLIPNTMLHARRPTRAAAQTARTLAPHGEHARSANSTRGRGARLEVWVVPHVPVKVEAARAPRPHLQHARRPEARGVCGKLVGRQRGGGRQVGGAAAGGGGPLVGAQLLPGAGGRGRARRRRHRGAAGVAPSCGPPSARAPSRATEGRKRQAARTCPRTRTHTQTRPTPVLPPTSSAAHAWYLAAFLLKLQPLASM